MWKHGAAAPVNRQVYWRAKTRLIGSTYFLGYWAGDVDSRTNVNADRQCGDDSEKVSNPVDDFLRAAVLPYKAIRWQCWFC